MYEICTKNIDVVRLEEYNYIKNFYDFTTIDAVYKGRRMVKVYLSIKETAEKWGVTPRRVQVLCATGRIEGAGKLGREWAIPADAERPKDERVTTGEYRNWRKQE